jgi:amidase
MRKATIATALLVFASPARAADLSGKWNVTTSFSDVTSQLPMELLQKGQALSGTLGGEALTGTAGGKDITLTAADGHGASRKITLTLKDGSLTGDALTIDGPAGPPPYDVAFTASRIAEPGAGPPKHLEFAATEFHHTYSAAAKPVLTIAPGDTVHTATIDAGGVDSQGIKRSVGPDPLIGPFFVSTALPGDVLAIHITRLALNRDTAGIGDNLVEGALSAGLARRMTGPGHGVTWQLNRQTGMGTIANAQGHLAGFTIPLHPMLGCIGLAPATDQAAPASNDTGSFGGNMDLSLIGEGATVYLPVRVPGALLYMGDGHAAQGDGEINGNALETSMDVEFTVSVVHERPSFNPRIETGDQLVAMGLGTSLDDAFKGATANMAGWLNDIYALTPPEAAQVMGTSAHYQVAQIPGRNVGIVLKLDKSILKPLDTAKASP